MSNKDGRRTDAEGAQDFDLQERLIGFAVRVMNVVEALPDSRIGNHVAGQLLRAGTSPAPNYGEAQSAESRRDFIHKLKVSLKELRETDVWLLMIQRKPLMEPPETLASIMAECNELISILVASIKTAEKNKWTASEQGWPPSELHTSTFLVRHSTFNGVGPSQAAYRFARR